MRLRWHLLALVVLVAAAGCAGFGDATEATPPDGAAESPASTATAAPGPTPPATATGTPTADPTPTPERVDPDNPFGTADLRVTIETTETDRDLRPAVESALAYWEEESEAYAGYPVSFTVVESGERPDVAIRIEAPPIRCGRSVDDRTTGCAPLNEETAPPVSEVTIAANHTRHFTTEIAIHELGHALGLSHGDEPRRYMSTVHPSGLTRDHVRVRVRDADGHVGFEVEREVTAAFEYFADADELAESQEMTWERVESAAEADVVVEYREDGPECFDDGDGSCLRPGRYRDQTNVVVEGIRTDAVGWHVASLIAQSRLPEDEVPEELTSDADYATRGGGWKS